MIFLETPMKHLDQARLASLNPLPGLIDSHIHLDSDAYVPDLEACLERAEQAGVTQMLLPSTDLASSRRIAQLTQSYPQLRGGLGIHPHQAASYSPTDSWAAWRELLGQTEWRAIGETGLELHYDFCPLETQQISLQAHFDLARETGLPLILHCRQAEEPLYAALRAQKPGLRGVVHCFTGGWEWAQRFLDLGFYLGLGGLVTLPKAHEVHDVAARVPSDRWLLETDGPYLSPVPFRGFRNESCLLPLVAARIAELRSDGVTTVVTQARTNYHALFSSGNKI
jgi:TatD DNase family protein